ncbi:MAG: SagB/ThcOx family dehydrogenase, partial [bacterium]|nr:SagB/ThcOx family dehydrogenase [bacterium]
RLDLPEDSAEPTYDSLFVDRQPAHPVPAGSLSRLLYYSLALSAWKVLRRPDGTYHTRWSLRVNPSSGNLHPTEGYLICGPVEGLCEMAALYHYAPHEHGLELRRQLDATPGGAYVGLTSIHWREAWKYGERAFRYCQHDVGHAIAAVAIAAAALGWTARLVESPSTDELARMLGVAAQTG